MSSPLTSRGDLKRAFVATYEQPAYDDSWDAIEEFERVRQYTAAHPQHGSYLVSKALDLPRGRVRSWVDGDGMPDCYRGLQTALSNQWIEDSWSGESIQALNCLAAWILSSGAINTHWMPTFVADTDGEIDALRLYADSADVRIERTRAPSNDRPSEWRPTSDATVLGRVIYTWIGIKGHKNHEAVTFPSYLETAPEPIVSAFLKVYVQQRGTPRDDRNGDVQIMAKRSDEFRNALKQALQRIVDDPGDIRGKAWPVRIRGGAAETLRQYPKIGAVQFNR